MTDDTRCSLLRHVRAAVFAAVCVVLAGAGHAVASGEHIPWQALLAAFGVTTAAAWLGAGRRRGVLSIGAGLMAVQGGLHLIFAGGHNGPRPSATQFSDGMGDMDGTGAGAMPAAAAAADAVGGSGAVAADGEVLDHLSHLFHLGSAADGSRAMLAVHLLAGLACAMWLWRGESAFFRLLRCLDARAFTPLRLLLSAGAWRTAVLRPVRHTLRAAAVAGRLRSALLAHVLSRRGPPYGTVFGSTAPADALPPRP
ncbi:hypothetical protein [Streptomyces sp. 8N616]|uniref:hypothetical protein n=1 Tax=Streptomyces sp. 8N616 TaxID=3457414 RepID=UPI003FD0AC10